METSGDATALVGESDQFGSLLHRDAKLGEPERQDEAGRACADDQYVTVRHVILHFCSTVPRDRAHSGSPEAAPQPCEVADYLRVCIFLRPGVPTTLSGWLLQERTRKWPRPRSARPSALVKCGARLRMVAEGRR